MQIKHAVCRLELPKSVIKPWEKHDHLYRARQTGQKSTEQPSSLVRTLIPARGALRSRASSRPSPPRRGRGRRPSRRGLMRHRARRARPCCSFPCSFPGRLPPWLQCSVPCCCPACGAWLRAASPGTCPEPAAARRRAPRRWATAAARPARWGAEGGPGRWHCSFFHSAPWLSAEPPACPPEGWAVKFGEALCAPLGCTRLEVCTGGENPFCT